VNAPAAIAGRAGPPILEARAVHAYYGTSHIVRGVDFAVSRGETVALMGRNGMGKTTLLKTLLGLVRARRGQVFAGGEDVTASPTHRIARRGIAYVPEGRGIFPNLSVRENLVMAARPGVQGQGDWTLDRVLATFPRLADRMGHGGGQLSGGEQQMLTIGRALMTNPDLLILDEATEGLAPLVAQEIWAIIAGIRTSGIATVLVDRNHAAVTAVADRAVVLVKGQVIFQGTGAQVRAEPGLIHTHLGV
jgi:branched-chain amino acid transport system ATP-binding protein